MAVPLLTETDDSVNVRQTRGIETCRVHEVARCLAPMSAGCVFKKCLEYLVYTTHMRWRDSAEKHVLLPIIPVENKLSSPLGCLQTD